MFTPNKTPSNPLGPRPRWWAKRSPWNPKPSDASTWARQNEGPRKMWAVGIPWNHLLLVGKCMFISFKRWPEGVTLVCLLIVFVLLTCESAIAWPFRRKVLQIFPDHIFLGLLKGFCLFCSFFLFWPFFLGFVGSPPCRSFAWRSSKLWPRRSTRRTPGWCECVASPRRTGRSRWCLEGFKKKTVVGLKAKDGVI